MPLRNTCNRPATGPSRASQTGLAQKAIGFRAESPYNPPVRGENEDYDYAQSKTQALEAQAQHAARECRARQAAAGEMPELPRDETASPNLPALRLLQGPRGAGSGFLKLSQVFSSNQVAFHVRECPAKT